jgi:phenylalanyl-tRNA synthetase beta subunit
LGATLTALAPIIGLLSTLIAKLATFIIDIVFIALQPLLVRFPPERPAAALPSFPSIERDISVVVPEATPWEKVEHIVAAAKLAHIGPHLPDTAEVMRLQARIQVKPLTP